MLPRICADPRSYSDFRLSLLDVLESRAQLRQRTAPCSCRAVSSVLLSASQSLAPHRLLASWECCAGVGEGGLCCSGCCCFSFVFFNLSCCF